MRAAVLAIALATVPATAWAAPPPASLQARRLEAAKTALEKLRTDPRRRRYRDAWEAVLRAFDAAVKAAPSGPRAAEAALAAARARVDLWEASRSVVDARAAIAALRKVEEDYPGPAGARALATALAIATRAHQPEAGAAAARRLADKYPQDAEAVSAAAPTAAAPESAPAPKISSAPPSLLAQKPADVGDADDSDDDEGDALPEPEAPADPPSRTTPIVRAVKNAVASLTEPEDAPAQAAKAREMRAAALAADSSLGAQLGLKIRRVVVDAGHGGKDTGAIGPHGVREKDIALAIARKLAARLRAQGFQVVMTRKDDSFVALDERARIANQSKADLFVSIHCNAARKRRLQGVETWTLNVASDRYATRLAAFENAEADRTVSDLRLILADLATKANAHDARDLAQSVQSSLVRTLSRAGAVRDHGVKQALFYVLLGAHMPSILIETGFISNPAEEARLRSRKFQDGTAEAVARGVSDFVQSRRRLASAF